MHCEAIEWNTEGGSEESHVPHAGGGPPWLDEQEGRHQGRRSRRGQLRPLGQGGSGDKTENTVCGRGRPAWQDGRIPSGRDQLPEGVSQGGQWVTDIGFR